MLLAARRLVPVVLAASLLAACQDDGVCFCEPPPVLTMNPAALAIAAGDSAPLTVTVAAAGGPPTIRLATPQPAIARVDSVAPSGVPTAVRAGTPGSTVVTVTATQNGQTVTGYVPVTVTARSAP
jgi:uncharacterized protein YjdB